MAKRNDPPEVPDEIEELIAQLPALADGEEPARYPHDEEAAHNGQDEPPFEVGAPGEALNNSREAIALGREWIRRAVIVGVGFCLRTIRSLYGVPPLWPDAETAWEQTERKHRTGDPDTIPWGVPVFWTNGGFGHIALSLGRGRCLTTDFVKTGQLGVAPISALGPWCGGHLAGWANDLNGVDVWEPRAAKPKPWTLEDRARFVEAALERAIANDAPERRVKGLRLWLLAIRDRIGKRAEK